MLGEWPVVLVWVEVARGAWLLGSACLVSLTIVERGRGGRGRVGWLVESVAWREVTDEEV